jgi:hypothetical protein
MSLYAKGRVGLEKSEMSTGAIGFGLCKDLVARELLLLSAT